MIYDIKSKNNRRYHISDKKRFADMCTVYLADITDAQTHATFVVCKWHIWKIIYGIKSTFEFWIEHMHF